MTAAGIQSASFAVKIRRSNADASANGPFVPTDLPKVKIKQNAGVLSDGIRTYDMDKSFLSKFSLGSITSVLSRNVF